MHVIIAKKKMVLCAWVEYKNEAGV